MGCDIHWYLEAHRNGAWELVSAKHPVFRDPDYEKEDSERDRVPLLELYPEYARWRDEGYDNRAYISRGIGERNYTLFGMLSNVRRENLDKLECARLFDGPDDLPDMAELTRSQTSSDDHSYTVIDLDDLERELVGDYPKKRLPGEELSVLGWMLAEDGKTDDEAAAVELGARGFFREFRREAASAEEMSRAAADLRADPSRLPAMLRSGMWRAWPAGQPYETVLGDVREFIRGARAAFPKERLRLVLWYDN